MKHRHKKIPEKRRRDHEEDLRSENRRLRKEIQQLRKQLSKMEFREEEIQEIMEDFEVEVQEEVAQQSVKRCPNCKSARINLLEKVRGNTDYYKCEACGSQGKYK